VLVVNKPGAGGNIAADMVAKAEPDGHTLVIGSSSTWVVNPHVYTQMPFDPVKSFTPVAGTSRQNFILVVHPKLNVSSVDELIARLKAEPGKLNYGSPGAGSLPQLACVLFEMESGTQATHIPYTGIAP